MNKKQTPKSEGTNYYDFSLEEKTLDQVAWWILNHLTKP